MSRDANLRAQAPLNGDNETPAITGDKTVFYRYCALLGIAVPEMFGILDTRASSWGASGRVMTRTRDIEAFVAEDLPARFVVKPSEGYAGRGVRLVERRDDGRLRVNGRTTTTAGLWSELGADDEFAVWIVQELLVNHPGMSAIGGSETLHTARITTLVGRDGSPGILFANLKLAISGGAVRQLPGGRDGQRDRRDRRRGAPRCGLHDQPRPRGAPAEGRQSPHGGIADRAAAARLGGCAAHGARRRAALPARIARLAGTSP